MGLGFRVGRTSGMWSIGTNIGDDMVVSQNKGTPI